MREFRPPPVQELQLGTKLATYRDYAPGTLCFAGRDYQPVLKGELEAMNELLAAFLQGTSSGPEGVWATEHVEMLERAQSSLLPALDTYEATLAQAKDCLFEHRHEFPDLARRGLEYARQSRQRVADAAGLLPQLRARAELKKWKDQQAQELDAERANWCPPKPRPTPDVYFAMEDETGRIEWHFCDGSRVAGTGSKPTEYLPPKEGSGAPKVVQGAFLRAASRYPQSQIRRAPKPPPAPPPAATTASEEAPASGSP